MVTQLYQYKLPSREGLILQIDEGFGEIAPLPGFSQETLAEAQGEVLSWIQSKTPPKLPSVRWGIECASHPLKSVHLPLSALGPKPGFNTVKLKLGHLTVNDAVKLVKNQDPKTRLRLDCNRAWTLEQAIEFTSHFKPTDFEYLEEPVKELAEFSKRTGFPVAVDESISCDWNQIPTLKAIVVKPMIVGHIPEVPPHLDLVLSSSYESGLGLLHIANRSRGSLPIGLDTVFQEDILFNKIQSAAGLMTWKYSNPIIDMTKLCAL